MKNNLKTIHALISGRVQGVFYRDSTRQKALELQLTGWVKNTADGRVEVLATGDEAALAKLIAWLWQGPNAAEVTTVDWQDVDLVEFSGFTVSRD